MGQEVRYGKSGEVIELGGAKYVVTAPTLTDGDLNELALDLRGNLKTTIVGSGGTTAIVVQTAADGRTSSTAKLDVSSFPYAFNGLNWDLARTPNVFKSVNVAVTAGTPAAIWTPAASKKFRLMGLYLAPSVTSVAIIKDSATELLRAPGQAALSAPLVLGNGILSAAANNALNLDATISATFSGVVFGTEE